MDWVTTSDDLVIGGEVGFAGDGVLNVEGRSCTAARLSSGSSPSRPDTDNMESGGCLTRYHPPLAPQYRPSCVLDGPSRPPSHGHRIPEHPLRSPLDPAGTTPPPRCPARLAALPPLGIDRLAGDARPQLASLRPLPSSGYAGLGLREASSRFRTAAGLGSQPAREAETHWALPIAPAPPLQGWWGGTRAGPASPGRGARHPTPPPLLPPCQIPPRARA